jgi:hypothetical protein
MSRPRAALRRSRAVAARTATIALLATCTVFAGPAAVPAHQAAPSKRCSDVPFTPNSDDVAANVRATRVTCRTARSFIRASQGHPARRHRGFTCTRTRVDGATLPHTRYRCVRGAKLIRWDRF